MYLWQQISFLIGEGVINCLFATGLLMSASDGILEVRRKDSGEKTSAVTTGLVGSRVGGDSSVFCLFV